MRHMFAAHSEACRWRCDGVGVDDLFKIRGTLDQQFNCSILQQHLNWFALSGTIICFSTRPKKTSKLSKGYLTICCDKWPVLHNHQIQINGSYSSWWNPKTEFNSKDSYDSYDYGSSYSKAPVLGLQVLSLIRVMLRTRVDPEGRNLHLLSILLRLMVNIDDVSKF